MTHAYNNILIIKAKENKSRQKYCNSRKFNVSRVCSFAVLVLFVALFSRYYEVTINSVTKKSLFTQLLTKSVTVTFSGMKMVNCNQKLCHNVSHINIKKRGGTENSTDKSQNIRGSVHLMSLTNKDNILWAFLRTSKSNLLQQINFNKHYEVQSNFGTALKVKYIQMDLDDL